MEETGNERIYTKLKNTFAKKNDKSTVLQIFCTCQWIHVHDLFCHVPDVMFNN